MDNFPRGNMANLFPGPRRPWAIPKQGDDGALAAAAAAGGPSAPPKPGGGSNPIAKAIVSGAVTGGIEICITYPTEFVKTQLQLDEKVGKYKGMIDCTKKTVAERGVLGLYKGLPVLIYGSVPKSACRFGAFEFFKSQMVDEDGKLDNKGRLLAGLGAGVTEAIFAVCPMESLKVKFINDQRSTNPRYKSFLHGCRMIIAEHGAGSLYQGLTATIMKQGSNQAIRFWCVETLRNWHTDGDPNKKVSPIFMGLYGGIAGAASVLGNTPLDVIKTRMQSLEAHKYKNVLDCARQIMAKEGPRAFYKGTMPRMSRVVLDVAITFMIYGEIKELINKVWP